MHRPKREIKMDEWKELIDLAVDLAGSDDLMDTGETGEKERERERWRERERERENEHAPLQALVWILHYWTSLKTFFLAIENQPVYTA